VENVGYIVAYRFVAKVMDDKNIQDFTHYLKIMESAEMKGRTKTEALFEEVNDPITKLKEISDRHQLEISFHPVEEKVGIGNEGRPISLSNVPAAECYYFYKVYVSMSEILDVIDKQEVYKKYKYFYENVILKEEELISKNEKKKKRSYFPGPQVIGMSNDGRKTRMLVSTILDPNPEGDWDLSRAKLLSAIKCIDILKTKGFIWTYEERQSKGIKGDVRRCGEYNMYQI
jgi:hypothetical protein